MYLSVTGSKQKLPRLIVSTVSRPSGSASHLAFGPPLPVTSQESARALTGEEVSSEREETPSPTFQRRIILTLLFQIPDQFADIEHVDYYLGFETDIAISSLTLLRE